MRVTSVLLMMNFILEEWRQLPKVGKLVENVGPLMLHLWEWTLTYRTPHSLREFASSQALPDASGPDTMVEDNKFKLGAFLVQSRPLAR
jgi:hypothetical protein